MDENDPINKPFAGLSGFLKEHRIEVQKEQRQKKMKEADSVENDEQLLREATGDLT